MDITQAFDERLQEINEYLTLLEALERQTQDGPPKIGGKAITAQQKRILCSSVYLQLYNLVEATATWCMKAVAEAAAENGRWRLGDLSVDLRREWVRHTARTHIEMNRDKRLTKAVEFCDRLIQTVAVSDWEIEKGGGGNWDDRAFEKMTGRIGLELNVSATAKKGVKQRLRDDKGALGLVKSFRNELAHGNISFSDRGEGVTVADLKDIKKRVEQYLKEVIRVFSDYIDGYKFLIPERRPVKGAPA